MNFDLDPLDHNDINNVLSAIAGVCITPPGPPPDFPDFDAMRIVKGLMSIRRPRGFLAHLNPGPRVMVCDSQTDPGLVWALAGKAPSWTPYPEELKPYYHRDIQRMTWGDFSRVKGRWFVKGGLKYERPRAQVLDWADHDGSRDPYEFVTLDDDDLVWACPEVKFVSEWRVFLCKGRILDIRPYVGNLVLPDLDVVREIVSAWTSQSAGCGVDVGVLSTGETAVVEVNDGRALGSYGLEPSLYAYLHASRWLEVMG